MSTHTEFLLDLPGGASNRDSATVTCRNQTPDSIREPRRGLSISAVRAMPYTREESDFTKAFAACLSHATAVVAADPEISVPVGSIAHRVREAYSGLRPDQRLAIQQRARARLAGTSALKQRYFGAYWDRGPEGWTNAERVLSRELRQQLKEAVRARLTAQRHYIAELLAPAVATELPNGSFPSAKTTLEVGHFTGDVQAAWTTQQINSPISLSLRWATDAAGAERGVWQLLRAGKTFGQSFQRKMVLASGHAGNAPGAIFTLDLGKYLPSEPPDVPAKYLIRVVPGTKPTLEPGARRGEMISVPGKAVGPPSNDVVITYSAVPPSSVEMNFYEIYQAALFQLDKIYMVEDQFGSGVEEFHVAGFVQESFPDSSAQPGVHDTFGPFYAALDPDGPRSAKLPHSRIFYLNKPNTPEWPRAYSIVISVLEEDDGGTLNDWESRVWSVAQELASGDVGQEIRDFLEEEFEDYVGDNIGQIMQSGGQLAQVIANLINGTTGAIVGMVVAAAALVASDIISGMSDDYYGTEVFVFVLPTNITDFVNSLPGEPDGSGFQVLETQRMEFRGYTSWPEATVFDGKVWVYFHWEFFDKVVTS